MIETIDHIKKYSVIYTQLDKLADILGRDKTKASTLKCLEDNLPIMKETTRMIVDGLLRQVGMRIEGNEIKANWQGVT